MDGVDATHMIHVRGIGVDGWDGTTDGRGTYENEEALKEIFSVFGEFVQATIRHRTQGGRSSPSKHKVIGAKNTSWALVEMLTAEAVKAALSADEVKAGS